MSDERDPLVDLLREVVDDRVQAARPGSLLGEVVEQARATPQRRHGWWPFGRLTWAGALAPSALVVVIAVVAVTGLISRPTGPGASPGSPGPTSSTPPASGVRVLASPGIDAVPLAGGQWQTALLTPPLRFEVPDGTWSAAIDAPRQLLLRAHLPGGSPDPEYDALTVVTIESIYINTCARPASNLVAWDPGQGPADFLNWVEDTLTVLNGPPVSLGPRSSVTILGAEGLEVEFTSPDLSRCAGNALFITDTGAGVPFRTPLTGAPTRYAVINLDGRPVLIATVAHSIQERNAVWAAADEVIRSLERVP